MTLTDSELVQLIGRYSADDQYPIVERLGIMYEDRPVTRQELDQVITDEISRDLGF